MIRKPVTLRVYDGFSSSPVSGVQRTTLSMQHFVPRGNHNNGRTKLNVYYIPLKYKVEDIYPQGRVEYKNFKVQ